MLAHLIELVVSFTLTALFLALMYKFLPSKCITTKRALIGGVISAVFFVLGKYAI